MKSAKSKTTAAIQLKSESLNQSPFFKKEGEASFFAEQQLLSPFGGGQGVERQPFFSPSTIQPKLTIGQPNDKYEVEADQMADKVVQRLADPKISLPPNESNVSAPAIQHKCSDCEDKERIQKMEGKEGMISTKEISLQRKPIFESGEDDVSASGVRVQRKCASCGKEEEDHIQEKSETNAPSTASSDLQSRLNSTKGGGSALPKETASSMGDAFGSDFSGVRIHTNSQAVKMNQELGAHAFTHGSDIYFNSGKYDTSSTDGKHLLAHELTHTVQQGVGIGVEGKRTPVPIISRQQSSAVGLRNSSVIQRDVSSEVQPCTDLGSCLGRIAMIADSQRRNPQSINNVVDDLLAQLRGPLLSDPNALREMTQEVSESFPTRVFGIFLNRLEIDARSRGETSPLDQMRGQQANQRLIRQMQNLTAPRRGPYGTRGPGVAIPVIVGVLRPLYNAYRSAKGFIRGLIGGFRQSARPRDFERLVEKLAGSVIITSVFPVVFVAGAIAGIVQDIVGAIVGIYRAVVNFGEVVASAKQILGIMVSDQGEQIGEELGTQTGIGYVDKLRSLLSQNVFNFTFNLGRIIGPTIIYTIIALLGLPVLLGAGGLSLRVINAIRSILRRVPGARRLQALLRLRRMRRRGLVPGAGGLVVHSGRLTIAQLLEWERLGGHMLQRHGPFHTRETLLSRILNETSLGGLPPPRNLPGGVRTTDFRVWQGNRQPHASAWRNQQEMLDAVGEIISDNITDIQRVTDGGGEVVLRRFPLSRPVGNGWVTAIRGTGERGIYWADNLEHATVIIRPIPGGGWRVLTAFPEL